jgi:hypothetical protein
MRVSCTRNRHLLTHIFEYLGERNAHDAVHRAHACRARHESMQSARGHEVLRSARVPQGLRTARVL